SLPVPLPATAGPATASDDKGFPWPPPPHSAEADLPDSVFREARDLGQADNSLCKALRRAHYRNRRYYELPEQAGFALITQFEQINNNCAPIPEPGRWSPNTVPCPVFSLGCVVRSLVFPSAGFWRVFVFVVTDRPLPPASGAVPGADEARAWFKQGSNRLPKSVRQLPFTAEHYGTVLIYEFEKQECCDVVLRSPSKFEGFTHLRRAGIVP
ncbi:MAG: hypothetical protein H7Z21_05350, partial [Hymenobacter sp.]|nr:hypothetical protein [Hymenobacter sp.]